VLFLIPYRNPRRYLCAQISAVYPDSIQAAKTLLVEPWLVLFCLIGALAVFDRDQLARSGRRIFWGGWRSGSAVPSSPGPSSRSAWP
jgi:hypothetical protein